MKPFKNPRVKVCCIASVEEAWFAIKYGASGLGLVSEMPSGPGPIPEELIAKIAKIIPPSVSSFLLTCKQDPLEIISQHRKCGTNVIQLVDRIRTGDYEVLRNTLPGIKLVQVVHVMDEKAIKEANNAAPYVDAILLDSGNPDLVVKELGGTGRKHNWVVSKQIREELKIPVFLAGGLHSHNVLEGLREVQPFAIDVCSGVRTENKLDENKLSAFFKAVNSYS